MNMFSLNENLKNKKKISAKIFIEASASVSLGYQIQDILYENAGFEQKCESFTTRIESSDGFIVRLRVRLS